MRELHRITDGEDPLNLIVGDVQYQRNGGLAVEITYETGFAVDLHQPRGEGLRRELRHATENRPSDVAGAVDQIWQRRRLAAAVGVQDGVAREQRDQTVEIAARCRLNEPREQLALFARRRGETRPRGVHVFLGAPQDLATVGF